MFFFVFLFLYVMIKYEYLKFYFYFLYFIISSNSVKNEAWWVLMASQHPARYICLNILGFPKNPTFCFELRLLRILVSTDPDMNSILEHKECKCVGRRLRQAIGPLSDRDHLLKRIISRTLYCKVGFLLVLVKM